MWYARQDKQQLTDLNQIQKLSRQNTHGDALGEGGGLGFTTFGGGWVLGGPGGLVIATVGIGGIPTGIRMNKTYKERISYRKFCVQNTISRSMRTNVTIVSPYPDNAANAHQYFRKKKLLNLILMDGFSSLGGSTDLFTEE